MATYVSTLGVNAAFLQEIKDDGEQLRRLLADSVECFGDQEEAMRLPPTRASALLASLRDQLAMHFTLEDAYGYFDDAIDVAPHLSERAEELRGEHAYLFHTICELADQAERIVYRELPRDALVNIAVGFSLFHHELSHHESQENELLWGALNDDIGVGD